MGQSYWFECARCGYRAKVSGRGDQGVNLHVQTISCHECKQLYDAVTRLRIPVETRPCLGWGRSRVRNPSRALELQPPTFQAALNRLRKMPSADWMWVEFKPQCPVSARHRIQTWNDPDKCPKCGIFLEKNPLPYRIWD